MESIMGMNIGGFLERLENEFDLVTKVRPILSKPSGRTVKYRINDNFLNFWFRFIYKYRSAIEIRNYNYVKNIIERDYAMFSGQILERYFKDKIITSANISLIGSYWEKDNQNEIDIVALNENEKTAIITEVKRNKDKINLHLLQKKASNLVKQLPGFSVDYRGLSLDDM